MEEPLINAIGEYFKLKSKYEKQFTDLKTKLHKNEGLSKKEKHKLFKDFVPKCVNCKGVGGSLFSHKDRVLKATCGATAKPCKLNIEINQGKYANILNLDENYSKNVDNIKTKIIMTKLDFLFGYIANENAAFDNFDQLRKNLGNYSKAQLMVQKKFNDVANNPEKKARIAKAETQLYSEIAELRNIYKLYQENPRASFLNEMVEKYLEVIEPLAEKIQKMKYVITMIEVDNADDRKDNALSLVQKEYTLADLEQEVYGDVKSGVVRNVV
jgi:hypothetical protein